MEELCWSMSIVLPDGTPFFPNSVFRIVFRGVSSGLALGSLTVFELEGGGGALMIERTVLAKSAGDDTEPEEEESGDPGGVAQMGISGS